MPDGAESHPCDSLGWSEPARAQAQVCIAHHLSRPERLQPLRQIVAPCVGGDTLAGLRGFMVGIYPGAARRALLPRLSHDGLSALILEEMGRFFLTEKNFFTGRKTHDILIFTDDAWILVRIWFFPRRFGLEEKRVKPTVGYRFAFGLWWNGG